MENSPVDDIGRLLEQVDLDRSKYREFKGGVSALMRLPSQPEPWEDECDIPIGLVSARAAEETEAKARPQLAGAKSDAPRQLAAPGQEWSVLDSLLKLSATHSPGTTAAAGGKTTVATGTTVFGACGGVGVTTIVSAMGRISAKKSETVLLVDLEWTPKMRQ